ncbi:MAG: hypothetical protein J6W60_00080 [Treponema sp.]|jgi:hypothetical protein|nr:hypothetical protein [Treponema sp.]
MISITKYKTEDGKTVKVEPETENGSVEKSTDNKKQKSKGKQEEASGLAETEEI